ncbi:HEAT repeat domain-containing protein [Streptomyces sp. NPDC002668]|uniref:HEAT repeat domain-containing protein n=1 Tax=Streptomyces sp. NPDC002668 TaxID=3154422 RepID=UPI00332160DA
MGGEGLGGRLMAAVRSGDAEVVRALLAEGADPDTRGKDGLPVLCAAVAAFDVPVAEALEDGGADPDLPLPDETTPLLRAVDLGSPAVFMAVLGREPRLRLPEPDRERLLGLARGWYERGAAEELRRRTGAQGPAETVRVPDGEYHHVEQITLGGLTVRAGHGSILTDLEWAFRVLTPVDELVARGVRHRDEDHTDWWSACHVLSQRPSRETWQAVTAYRHHPDPLHRRFALEFLWSCAILPHESSDANDQDTCRLLATWAPEETDTDVLAKILELFAGYTHSGQEAVGHRYTCHPEPRVRQEVPYLLCAYGVPLTPTARVALLTLARDLHPGVRAAACAVLGQWHDLSPGVTGTLLALLQDPEVRGSAATALAGCPDRSPAVTEALAGLLDDEDLLIRLEAVYGLAQRDDPRCVEGLARIGPLDPAFDIDHRPLSVWHYEQRRRAHSSAPAEPQPRHPGGHGL